MHRLFATVVLGSLMTALMLTAPGTASAQSSENSSTSGGASGTVSLLAPPPGKSTVMGGAIQDVNPVLDQFTLHVFGGGSVKILFDARTQVYLDGTRIPLRDLQSAAHASVETVLDRTNNIFAISIHMLSEAPEGRCQGQVLSYDAGTGELTVSSNLSHQPVRVRVPAGTPISRTGQSRFTSGISGLSDLRKGTLVDVQFRPDNKGHGVASHISVLAIPGADFVFSGRVSFLDVPNGRLVIVDPQDNRSYQIFVDAGRIPLVRQLHEGDHVTVTASFTGNRYTATAIREY